MLAASAIGKALIALRADTGRVKAIDYSMPKVSCGGFNPFGDMPVAGAVDKLKPYLEARALLQNLGLEKVVEGIVIEGRTVVEVGKEYSGRQHEQQARCAAITALAIGLRVLRNHYDPPSRKAAA
jgi:hypothetical protein